MCCHEAIAVHFRLWLFIGGDDPLPLVRISFQRVNVQARDCNTFSSAQSRATSRQFTPRARKEMLAILSLIGAV